MYVKYTLLNMGKDVQQPSNSYVHILIQPINDALKDSPNPEKVTEQIMSILSESGIIQYAPKNTLNLLTAPGRVLVCLLENPGSTIREIAVRLGVTENNVGRSVSQLAEAKLIARTKVKNRYVYSFDEKTLLDHPDIRRFYKAISAHFPEQSTIGKV